MLTQWVRTIFNDNSVLTDFSIESQNRESFAIPYVAGQDYVYIAQYFPFNNFFIETDVANDQASVVSVDYISGKQWVAAVDIIDGTKASGISLSKAGVVQFTPDDYNWTSIVDPRKIGGTSLGIEALPIFDLYWIRVKFSASLKATTSIKSISYNFSTDRLLESIDPEIDNYKEPWGGVSKTNWVEQTMLGSQHVVAELKSRGLILSPGNILRFDDVCLATTYRTLMIIYAMLGKDFEEKYKNAEKEFKVLMDIKRFTFDKNQDGKVQSNEISLTVAQGVR
jgi:hypothetical protein